MRANETGPTGYDGRAHASRCGLSTQGDCAALSWVLAGGPPLAASLRLWADRAGAFVRLSAAAGAPGLCRTSVDDPRDARTAELDFGKSASVSASARRWRYAGSSINRASCGLDK